MGQDVIVIGAGPAGSHCAYHLARAGAKVLVLEKSRLPREKICAGALSAGALSLLDFDVSPLVRSKTNCAIIAFGGRRRRVSLSVTAGCTVERRDFDYSLTEKAASAGAKIMDCQKVISVSAGTSPTVQTEKEKHRGDFVVFAAGSVSGIRPRPRFESARRFALAAVCTLPREKSHPEEFIFDFSAVPCGYGWVFPKGENISVGVYSLKVRRQKLLLHFARFVSRHTDSRKRISPKVAPVALQGTSVCFEKHILPVGDSLGAADPFTGKGIYGALKTGTLAAEAIIRSPQNAAAFYKEAVRLHLRNTLFSMSLSRLLYSQQELTYETLMRFPASLASFSAAVADMTTYVGAFVRSVAGLGIFPFPFPEERRSS